MTSLRELLNDMSQPDLPITGITENVSEVQPGFLFCAIKGSKANGADFVPEAVQRGACAILSNQEIATTVPVIYVENPRKTLLQMSIKLYPSPQLKKIAVTGTNGKTSTVYYVTEILNALGIPTASLGTIGVKAPNFFVAGNMTTPDGVTLNKLFHQLQDKQIQIVALEASSHGLDQGRLEGNLMQVAAFTNLTRDHLDYHKTMENYLKAKMHLFTDYLSPNGTAVLNADIPEYFALKELCDRTNHPVLSYGKNAQTLKLLHQTLTSEGQEIIVSFQNKEFAIPLKIYGDFQAYNILCAVGLCMGLGLSWEKIYPILSTLVPPEGRLQVVGQTPKGAKIFVDYAHTPDALERVLLSLRAHTSGKLVCLFGCGGNRDTGKRSQMGEIANRLADKVYITDDNPRFEEPELIRKAIQNTCPKAIVVDNRRDAIALAIQNLEANDTLILAGKGHESGQSIKGINYPFNDKIEAQLVLKFLEHSPLWTSTELHMALNTPVDKKIKVSGVTFNSKEVHVGDLFIALTNGKTDGHLYVKNALEKGASACVVDHLLPDVFPYQQIVVPDTTLALQSLARFARMRTTATVIGITGSCGKTTTKEMLTACLKEQGKTHATQKNLNNNLGVPFTLANMPADTQYAVIEMGISHPKEMSELSDFVRPDITLITNIAPAHQEYFPDTQAIAQEKIHIVDYQNKEGTIILNHTDAHYQFLADTALSAGVKKIIRFGSDDKSDFQLLNASTRDEMTLVTAHWHGERLKYVLHFTGYHFALNSLATLAAIDAAGASVETAIHTLETLSPVEGRGKTASVIIEGKTLHFIDDAYNANPVSMKASLEALGLRSGRKIAVLGDMLELGEKSYQMHLDILEILAQNNIDRLYAVGPIMNQVFDLAPPSLQGAKSLSATGLADILRFDLQEGDWVLFKASHGTGLDALIKKLKGE